MIDRIPLLKNKTIQKIGFGLGMGVVAVKILDFIPIPQLQANKRIIQLGIEAITEPISAVVDVALGSGIIPQLGGGGNSSNGNSGFA